jgi:hypothetical protein
VGDTGDIDEGDGGEQVAGEEPPSRGGIRPDVMILEGWPETSPPPQGPTKTYKMRADKSKMKADESRRVTIIIGELSRLQLRPRIPEDNG